MAILRLFGAINAGCFLPNFTFQPSLILDLTNLSILVSVLYLFIFISFLSFQKPLLNFESITVYIFISVGYYLPFAGLLPRPPPEGFPVLLGQLGLVLPVLFVAIIVSC